MSHILDLPTGKAFSQGIIEIMQKMYEQGKLPNDHDVCWEHKPDLFTSIHTWVPSVSLTFNCYS